MEPATPTGPRHRDKSVSLLISPAEGVHSPKRPAHLTGFNECGLLSTQCQLPGMAHLLLESLMQSSRWTTPTIHPSGRLRRACFERRSVRELRQHLFRIPLWVSRRVNQQRSTVVSPPRAILNIFPKVEDGERPRLPDRQRFQFWRRLPQTR